MPGRAGGTRRASAAGANATPATRPQRPGEGGRAHAPFERPARRLPVHGARISGQRAYSHGGRRRLPPAASSAAPAWLRSRACMGEKIKTPPWLAQNQKSNVGYTPRKAMRRGAAAA